MSEQTMGDFVAEQFEVFKASGRMEELAQEAFEAKFAALFQGAMKYGLTVEFEQILEEKIKASLRDCNMAVYADTVAKALADAADRHAQENAMAAAAKIAEQLKPAQTQYTLEDLVELFRADLDPDSHDSFYLHVECGPALDRVSLDVDPRTRSPYSAQYRITLGDDGRVWNVTVDGKSWNKHSHVGRLFGWERVMFSLYFYPEARVTDLRDWQEISTSLECD